MADKKRDGQKAMDTERLVKNIIDQIKEAQLKLGYARETVRLYYPAASLCSLLVIKQREAAGLLRLLEEEFAAPAKLGPLSFRAAGERIAVTIPPEGAAWVHDRVPDPPFLSALIGLFREKHHCSRQELLALFERFGPCLCREMPAGMDFDYALYFADPETDSYYYCIREEMGHTIYHRFTKEDFELLFMA